MTSKGTGTASYSEDASLQQDWERLFLVLGGHIYFQTLSAAVRLDLFTLLAKRGELTRSEIASSLGVAEKPVRILLLGCTALGLLRKRGDKYSNAPLAGQLLSREAPGNVTAVVEWQHFINYKAMYHFHDAIRENKNVGLKEFAGDEKTLYERLVHHPDLEKIFQNAMQAISVQANATLAQFVDFSHVKHLVDVGGGNGTNIIALSRKYPSLRATVFDSPSVCQIARKNIEQSGLADRLNAVPGNCFTDPFPRGIDCLLFAHFFSIWSEEQNRSLLKKAHDALPPGGSVLIFNMMQSDDETGPLSAALGSPYFLTLATGEGMLYTWHEYETWMRDAGFTSVKQQVLPRDHGVVIGTKG
jgi:cyclopropane fatty-acyl-phospholipid synthase-like methyltransferase